MRVRTLIVALQEGANLLDGMLGRHLAPAKAEHTKRCDPLLQRKAALRQTQRDRRAVLHADQAKRAIVEAQRRAARFRTGLRGLWDRLIGKHAKTSWENEVDARAALQRDRAEQQALITGQLGERLQLQQTMRQIDELQEAEVTGVHREMTEVNRREHGPESKPEANAETRQPASRRQRHEPAP